MKPSTDPPLARMRAAHTMPDPPIAGREPFRHKARGNLAVIFNGVSTQVGAAIGVHAFAVVGPVGVVAVRQLISAAVLLPAVRPRIRSFTWRQWWPVLLLGLMFGGMNLSLYAAVNRIGLGLSVTLEFLGPLAVALAGSRRMLDLACVVGAGTGVYVLILPDRSTDVFGVGLGLLAGVCWASYILLNRLVSDRLPGLQATATASGFSAIFFLPVFIIFVLAGTFTLPALLCALAAGVLSSVVPWVLDSIALRTVPTRVFGILMSIHPVCAAAAGAFLLGQVPAAHQVIGICIVVTINVVAVGSHSRAVTGSGKH